MAGRWRDCRLRGQRRTSLRRLFQRHRAPRHTRQARHEQGRWSQWERREASPGQRPPAPARPMSAAQNPGVVLNFFFIKKSIFFWGFKTSPVHNSSPPRSSAFSPPPGGSRGLCLPGVSARPARGRPEGWGDAAPVRGGQFLCTKTYPVKDETSTYTYGLIYNPYKKNRPKLSSYIIQNNIYFSDSTCAPAREGAHARGGAHGAAAPRTPARGQ